MLRSLLRTILKFFYTIECSFSEEATKSNGIIVCNHQSFLDGLLLGLFLPQAPLFVIDRKIAERWYFKLPLRFIDHVTIDSDHPMSIKYLVEIAKSGRSIVVFPEGRITITGSFMKFYEGSAFVAYRAGVPLIPVYLDGAEFTYFSRLKGVVKRRLFTPIRITMADPFKVEIPPHLSGRERRAYLADHTHRLFMDFRVAQYRPTTLFESLLTAKRQFGADHLCAEDIEYKPLTYRQLIKRSLAVGRVLAKESNPKERIGILLPNALITALSIMGASSQNRIPALLNYTAGVDGLQAAIDAANLKKVLTSRKFIEKANLTEVIAELKGVEWLYAEDLPHKLSAIDKLWLLKTLTNPMKYLPKIDPNDEAVVLFTSGSEGKPKGVVHTHKSLLSNVEQLRTVADFTTQDKFMITLPLFHAFGLTVGTFLPLISGAKVFYYPSPLHYRVIPEVIYQTQATVLFGTSTFLYNYARRGSAYDFASLRYVIAGAERLSEETRVLWQEKIGQRILEGYGVTECAPVISINVPMNYKLGTVGRILPNMEYRLTPVDGIEKGGELIVKGDNVMAGYLFADDQEGTLHPAQYEGEKGWYATGDIVEIDKEGYITIKGRAKRFAKISGEMISLEVVENLMKESYPKGDHAATIVRDLKRGESIIIYTTEKRYERKHLIATAQKLGVSMLAIPKEVHHLEEIPLLGSGKIDYVTLNRLAEVPHESA